MHACLAKTISTWLPVLVSKEGLKCLLDAKDSTGKMRACNANGATAQVDAQQLPVEREAMQFISNALRNFGKGFEVLGREEALECWSEGKDDEEKMHACLAKTTSTWLAVLVSEEGLKCLLAAKYSPGKIRACNANGATALAFATKANGATAVSINFLLGASLAILLLVRAS